MLGLRRGLEGGKHSDERAIHREISGKESEGERDARRGGSADVCTGVSVLARASGVCVCVV